MVVTFCMFCVYYQGYIIYGRANLVESRKRQKKRELLSLLSFGWRGSFLKVLRAEVEMLLDHVEQSVNTIW